MARLFEKGRRWHEPCSEPYGRVLLLQRLYQALTSLNPPVGPPYVSTTNFAALITGPGNVKPVHGADSEGVPNVTTHRVSSKDRQFVDELNYKGWSIKLADWLHLANPDDPSRPIIGQVFRCWVSDEPSRKGQAGVTVSWYYRPEQTYHPANRAFWEGEVFKTSMSVTFLNNVPLIPFFQAISPIIQSKTSSKRLHASSPPATFVGDLDRPSGMLAGRCTCATRATTTASASSSRSRTGTHVFPRKCGRASSSCRSTPSSEWCTRRD